MSDDENPSTRGDPAASASGPSSHGLEGRTLGDFQIERRLGQGGMGEVYLARQVSLGRSVALKVLRPELTHEPVDQARLEAEAWSIAQLNHPNIVHVYMLGHAEGLRFLVMEYVDGSNLRELLLRQGVLEMGTALSILEQTTRALTAAGDLGLVHRDIKPENLLLTHDGRVKVADFGLCRETEAQAITRTNPDLTPGTPCYMSPEQLRGLPLDQRSDLYALGVTAYEMLAGEPPFSAGSPLAIALRHLNESPVRLDEHRSDLPEELVDLVMRLLAKAPDDRHPSAAALLGDLERLGAGVPAAPRASRPLIRGRRGRRDRAALVVAAMLLLGGFLAGAAWGWHGRPGGQSAEPGRPGLWMAPWTEIPGLPTARAQYQYALIEAPPESRLAAWLAVPGRFPGASGRVYQAYVQIARHLLRHGEADRLDVLAEELETWRRDPDQRPLWQALSRIARAGAGAIRGDGLAVKGQFQAVKNLANLDPAVAELGLEVILLTQRPGTPGSTDEQQLNRLRGDLLGPLGLSELDGLPVGGAWLFEVD